MPALIAAAAPASAEPPAEAGLVWRAPDSCPDAAEVRARIERRLGTPMDRAVRGIAVEIVAGGDGLDRPFVARIDLRAVTAEHEIRVLTSARCDALTDAVAVVIARIATSRPAAQEVASQAPPAVAPPPPVAPRVWGGGLRMAGISGIGALPRVALAAELTGYLRRRALFVELSVSRWMPSPQFRHVGSPGPGDVRLDVAIARVGWRSARLPLRGWLAGELGAMAAPGGASEDAGEGTNRWVGVGAGFGVSWEMASRARLVGVLELVVPLDRASFDVMSRGETFRQDPVAVRCGLGLELGW